MNKYEILCIVGLLALTALCRPLMELFDAVSEKRKFDRRLSEEVNRED